MNPVILVDIDGTLIEKSLERLFLRYAVRTGKIQPGRLFFKLMIKGLKTTPREWLQLKLMYLNGLSIDAAQELIEMCWDDVMSKRLKSDIVKIVRWFQNRGDRVVLLSGTPRPLALPLMKTLGISEIICVEPETQDGKYTGRLKGIHPRGQRKVAAAQTWLRQNDCRWNQTVALANHGDDRFLLEAVKFPIAVYPDEKLRKFANHNEWMIIDSETDFNQAVSVFAKNI